MQLTQPAPRWFVQEDKINWVPYNDDENEIFEKLYLATSGRSAYYLTDERRVDFFLKIERRKQNEHPIRRGTWFFKEDDNSKWTPYAEETSKELERQFQSGNFERVKVTLKPLRYVEQRSDGSFRQYRYSKNADVLGRPVIRGYNGYVIPLLTTTTTVTTPSPLQTKTTISPPRPLTPISSSTSTSSPSGAQMTFTVTASPSSPRSQKSESVVSPRSSQWELTAPPLCKTTTMTSSRMVSGSGATITSYSKTQNPSQRSERNATLASQQHTSPPSQKSRAMPLSTSISNSNTLSASEETIGLGISEAVRQARPPRNLTREKTIKAKMRLLELAQQYPSVNVQPKKPEELEMEATLKDVVKKLQEENDTLRQKLQQVQAELSQLRLQLPETQQQVQILDKQNDDLASFVLDKEDEIEQKNIMIELLMQKIRNITGRTEVTLPEAGEVDEEIEVDKALTNLVRAYDMGDSVSKSQLSRSIGDILKDLKIDELDDFDEILK